LITISLSSAEGLFCLDVEVVVHCDYVIILHLSKYMASTNLLLGCFKYLLIWTHYYYFSLFLIFQLLLNQYMLSLDRN